MATIQAHADGLGKGKRDKKRPAKLALDFEDSPKKPREGMKWCIITCALHMCISYLMKVSQYTLTPFLFIMHPFPQLSVCYIEIVEN